MVRNNIEADVKVKCIEQGKTQAKLAEEIDTTKTYVNHVIKNNESVVNNTFVKMGVKDQDGDSVHVVIRERE